MRFVPGQELPQPYLDSDPQDDPEPEPQDDPAKTYGPAVRRGGCFGGWRF